MQELLLDIDESAADVRGSEDRNVWLLRCPETTQCSGVVQASVKESTWGVSSCASVCQPTEGTVEPSGKECAPLQPICIHFSIFFLLRFL